MKRIAFFGVKTFPSRGGTDRVAENIILQLKDKFEITVYCFKDPAAKNHMPGVRVIEFKQWKIFGMGGDQMRAEGMEILVHIRDMAFMGFVEVARTSGPCFDAERCWRKRWSAAQPEAVLLIDYPGFNLRFARRAKKAGRGSVLLHQSAGLGLARSRVDTIRRARRPDACDLPV